MRGDVITGKLNDIAEELVLFGVTCFNQKL